MKTLGGETMSLNIGPLLSALRRSPAGAILVTLQVAITLGVLVNATWIAHQDIEQTELPVGFDIQNTFALDIAGLSKQFNLAQAESADLSYLRGVPGVAAATLIGGVPLTGYGPSYDKLWRRPGQRGPAVRYNVLTSDDQTLGTLQVPLVAGRNFRPYEIQPLTAGMHARNPFEIIVTQALADALFPHGGALGRTVYNAGSVPATIIGITRNFVGPVGRAGVFYRTALVPVISGVDGFYALLVRTRPDQRDAILNAARLHIGASHRDGVISAALTLSAAKQGFEANNRNIAIFLAALTALILAVCCLGIFGLTTFNVGSRTRQIGTRRAVGARRRDIVAHFMVENAIILTAGAVLGTVLALAISAWLTVHYSKPRLDLAYLLTGVVVLWVIGQLAAWQPARRAASVAPSVATRTV